MNEPKVQLELFAVEVAGIVQCLESLPTSSGAWPLVQKIKTQVEAQLKAAQQPQDPS